MTRRSRPRSRSLVRALRLLMPCAVWTRRLARHRTLGEVLRYLRNMPNGPTKNEAARFLVHKRIGRVRYLLHGICPNGMGDACSVHHVDQSQYFRDLRVADVHAWMRRRRGIFDD